MIWIRMAMMAMVVVFLVSLGISVAWEEKSMEAEACTGIVAKAEIEPIVRGAVEDQSWMYSQSKDEVRTFLSQYFVGVSIS